jgi:hypothetical protein
LLAKFDTLPRRHAQQVSRSPNDICIEFVGVAVGVSDFPHHLNDLTTALTVKHFIKFASEVIKINGVAIDGGRFFNNPRRGVWSSRPK